MIAAWQVVAFEPLLELWKELWSESAIALSTWGGTMPIQYVRRWNREFAGEEAASQYSSIVVVLENKDTVAAFGAWLNRELGLQLTDSQGERFSLIITVVTLLFVLISVVIVVIAAINITHNFFMQVGERRAEIGLMRALGATKSDVRAIFVGEAALLGIVAGSLGVLLGFGAAMTADYLLASRVPEFAFKPESFFAMRPLDCPGRRGRCHCLRRIGRALARASRGRDAARSGARKALSSTKRSRVGIYAHRRNWL